MRRSRSQSNLPLPKRSTVRSYSTSRFSRNPSIDRASSHTNLAVTPLHHRGTSSVSSTPSSVSKSVNNKQWVHEQHIKVQKYIKDNPHLFANKINPDCLKPPSLKTFVELVSILFKQLQIKVKISDVNYKEILPVHMKILLYPGTIASSSLRLVTSSIAFPQVIAILAYLVDVIHMITPEEQAIENEFLKKITVEYERFVGNENEYSFDSEDAASLTGVNVEEYNRQRSDIESLNNTQILFDQRQKELLEENKALKEEVSRIDEEIQSMKYDGAMTIKTDDERYQKLQNINKELRENKNLLNSKANLLMESINKQPCTASEREEILKKIEELKFVNSLQSERLNVANEVNQEREQQFNETVTEITQIIRKSNTNLMRVIYEFQELREFKFPEQNFLDSETEIENIVEKTKLLVEDVVSRKAALIEALKVEEEALELGQEIISRNYEENSNLKHELKQILDHFKLSHRDKNELIFEIEQQIDTEKARIKQMDEVARTLDNDYSFTLASLHEKSSEVKNRMRHFSEHARRSAINLNNTCMELAKQIDLLTVARDHKMAEILEYKVKNFLLASGILKNEENP